ncbi:MAG TPA: pirin family protein [Myxococcaceae bacterium]|nr:pirin family protein [Myxococcaceae bacterium]
MISLRRSEERGHFDFGWLDTRHTFSFADYHDPKHMGFRSLRVINEDRVQPGRGFGKHPHRDMEILTYVLEGVLQHEDSMGHGSAIRAGDVQRMSAGTGVLHSEFNGSTTDLVHFLQIWILPERPGLSPSYEQKTFSAAEKKGRLRLLASRDGRDGSLAVHQDAALYASILGPGERTGLTLERGRHAWVQVARGSVRVNGHALQAGDGARISEETRLDFACDREAEFLVFDLA